MSVLKAPFNFVPLEETVFFPSWQSRISQDVPFSDSVSGSIDISIKAKTPIFVRNGIRQLSVAEETKIKNEKKANNGEFEIEKQRNSFSHTADGRYFIPGTSIKGELRNVLEILSFGKMTQVQDARFGIRDLNDRKYRDKIAHTYCGWLFRAGGVYYIQNCKEPLRISPGDISTALVSFGCEFPNDADEKMKSASEKYRRLDCLQDKGTDINFEKLHKNFSFKHKTRDGRQIYKPVTNGEISGTIVLTGQPGPRNNNTGKGKLYEFIFQDIDSSPVPVADEIFNNFKTIHCRNYDFVNLWEPNLNKGRKIPVFFTFQNEGTQSQFVEAIGLSYMFRYPSRKSIYTAIPDELRRRDGKDLAECIFGTIDKGKELKGRVIVSPAWLEGIPKIGQRVDTTLSSPKPSYAPLYVEQGSWMNPDARIKGRKRYPVRNGVWNNGQGNQNTETSFYPLEEGSLFNGRIYFHNLKEAELGAIIAALTFNGHDKCFHSIGEAKPLGYGKVKIRINKLNITIPVSGRSLDPNEYLKSFRSCIKNEYLKDGGNIDDTPSVSELINLAIGIPAEWEDKFKYMKMTTNRNHNEFIIAKNNNLNLPKFSDIINGVDSYEIKNSKSYQIDFLSSITEDIAMKNATLQAKRSQAEADNLRKQEEQILAFLTLIDEFVEKHSYEQAITICRNGFNATGSYKLRDKEKEIQDAETSYKYEIAKAKADGLFESGNYEAAKAEYEIVSAIKNDSNILGRIDECIRLHDIERRVAEGLESYLPPHLNSIAAYTGRLAKWKKECNVDDLGEEDKKKIIDNINSLFAELPDRDRVAWRRSAPERLRDYLGEKVNELKLEQ